MTVRPGFPARRWRILAALLAAVAVLSLVHWHLLFEVSGSETLRDAANQCAACAAPGSAVPTTLDAKPHPIAVASVIALPETPAPAAWRPSQSPRAPPA